MPFKSLHPKIQSALEKCGYDSATPIQAKAIPEILEGKDIVACAQTGSGKTAAFVLPALHKLTTSKSLGKPSVLILTPTRELATQIMTAARKYGSEVRFNIISLVGGMSYDPQIRDLKRGADIIVATPGRLIDHLENKRVDLSNVSMLVLDEADRMVDMGFIEDVELIASKTPEDRQTLFFSATVDKSIIQIVKRLLKNPVHIDLSKEKISTPKIKQTVIRAKNMTHKTRMLKQLLNDENIYKAIIFSATKTNADKLASELRDDGFAATPLHGDLRQNVRNRTIEAFRQGKVQFLVATDVAARGLDINDITHVINYDLPKFSEDYVHRIGRTGRAGKTGEAISFCSSTDLRNLQRIERYIGTRLPIQNDSFEYGEESRNSRSDADKFSPDDMMPPAQHGRGGSGGKRRFNDKGSFGDRPRKRFDRDDARPSRSFSDKPSDSSDRPRKSFDRDEERAPARSFGEKRPFNKDRADSSDRPRKRFERDDERAPARSFGEKRPFSKERSDSTSDRPRKRFERDDEKAPARSFGEKRPFSKERSDSSDRPRKRFERDDERAPKAFGAKRSFSSDRSDSSDSPRKRFLPDDARPAKSFGEKRRSSSSDQSDFADKPRKRFVRDDDKPRQPFGEKRRFSNDKPESSDRPRKRFDREEGRSSPKPFGEKRRFGSSDRPASSDRPRKSFDRDSSRSSSRPARPAKENGRNDSVFERPTYEFEKREGNPKVLYKKRTEGKARTGAGKPTTSRSIKPAGKKSAGAGKFTKKPFRDSK